MAKISCPRCRRTAQGGKGFWGPTKPYCASCGWNVERAREAERSDLSQTRLAAAFFAAIFGVIAFWMREGFALFPFALLSAVGAAGALFSWKRLKALEKLAARAPLRTEGPTSSSPKDLRNEPPATHGSDYAYVRALSRPRPVRPKALVTIVYLAFPISVAFFAYLAYPAFHDGLLRAGQLADALPFLLIGGAWSAVAVFVIRRARRDRRLLEQGELGQATITAQYVSGGKNRRSKITYVFCSLAGETVQSEATDDTWTLYEEMQTPVFYNPQKPNEHVLLLSAYYALRPS